MPDDQQSTGEAFPVRATKPDKKTKPDIDKVISVTISEGPLSKKEAVYMSFRSRHSGEGKHDSLSIKSYGRKKGQLYDKPEHSVTLSSKKDDEIGRLVEFALAARSGSVPDESGEFVVVGADNAGIKEALVRFLSDLSASGKIDTLADVLGQIQYDRHLLTSLLDRAARDPKLFAEAAAALNLVTYKQAFDELERLVEKEGVKEKEFQKLLEENPWMFGSEYSKLLPNRTLTRNEEQDFIQRRTADGYLELIEIKKPLSGKTLFNFDDSHDSYYPSAPLAKVLGQVQNYLDLIDADRYSIGHRDSEDPFKMRAKIIIGRSGDSDQLKALRSLNGHLMRIEVITFDQLVQIARNTLSYLYGSIRPARQAV